MRHWKFTEDPHYCSMDASMNNSKQQKELREFGSGYPSDPVCKKWLASNLRCKIFGYPDVVRFSWGPAKKALKANAFQVEFEADLAEEDDDEHPDAQYSIQKQQQRMKDFLLQPDGTKKRKRYPYFERNRIEPVQTLL